MDLVTHAMTGVLLGRAFTKDKESRAAALLLAVVSVFPDIDYISRFWGVDVFLRYHRGLTHGVLFMVLVPGVLTLLWRLYTGGRAGFWFVLSAVAYCVHLLLDMITQYPMRLLAPFSWRPFSWDLVFILDPYITGAIVFGLYLSFKSKKPAQRAHIVTAVFCVLALYVGIRATFKSVTGNFLKTQMTATRYHLYPLPNDFLRWWFVVEDQREYRTGFVDLFTETVCLQDILDKNAKDPLLERTGKLPEVKNFLYFARQPYPVVYRGDGPTRVVWRELSYSFLPGEHFVAVVEFNRAGSIKRAYAKIR